MISFEWDERKNRTNIRKHGIAFEEEKLQSDCAVLVKAIGTLFLKTLMLYMMNDYSSNLTRVISMHFSETVYVLLKNAHSKEALD